MAADAESYRSPYTPYPGSSTPSPEVPPTEGIGDLWAFFGLSVASTVIIAVSGIVVWWYVHHG